MKLEAKVSIDLQVLMTLGGDRQKTVVRLLSGELAEQIDHFLYKNYQLIRQETDENCFAQTSSVSLHLLTTDEINKMIERAAGIAGGKAK